MYFVKTPKLFTKIFPDIIWECPLDRPELHLTFDDGPSQNTHQILDFLVKHDIKASFFCLGKQIEKYPDAFERIKQEGHTIGNHGYAHLDGWKTSFKTYTEDIEKGSQFTQTALFRPPFGRLKIKQFKHLKEIYKIVMWSLMPGDFDEKVSPKICQDRIESSSQSDIIVLHDNDYSKVIEVLESSYQI